jgi:hypothetical protein
MSQIARKISMVGFDTPVSHLLIVYVFTSNPFSFRSSTICPREISALSRTSNNFFPKFMPLTSNIILQYYLPILLYLIYYLIQQKIAVSAIIRILNAEYAILSF